MRNVARFVVLLTVLMFLSGPLAAASLVVHQGPALSAPAASHAPAIRAWLVEIGFGLAVFGITIRQDTGTLAAKFVMRAGAAAGDYKTGVANAGGDWEANTKNAEPNYEAGVQQSIADKRFGKGVSGQAGKYQKNATELGATRYGPGVANAKDAWARGVQPALDTLKSLNLPPKGPRRSPQNMARANAVATALGALKSK